MHSECRRRNGILEHLTEDFEVIESDGSVLNKAEFPEQYGKRAPGCRRMYKLQDVNAHCGRRSAGPRDRFADWPESFSRAQSRYTDVYLKTGNGWRAMSAQDHPSRSTGGSWALQASEMIRN